ncbi:MAG: autophagy protein Apg6-domain-containing protein [Lentinula lateritia]|uniref:APG6-domain-containing protein n=1 Tax=Lentinula lateritia TaxID=40482 RepID=A0ABQ8VSN4_9AGAR|nr:MAG: autophagy protein Apg6-domain-containing protein [Lentinula lateritia]KAJ4498239.1 APG6-domain-containing protein [Lentinula lateritia]
MMSNPSVVCQQCKEPLQLDASLVDLAPSAYDTIIASLPPRSSSTHLRHATDAEKVGQPSAPSSVREVWRKSKGSPSSAASLSPKTQGKQPQNSTMSPHDSFVLLQDSVVHHTPSISTPSRSKKGSIKAKSSANSTSVSRPPETVVPNSPLSHHLRSTVRLFNLISSRTDIDHPLCTECTQVLLTSLQRQLDETKKERDGYIAFEKEVRKERERESQGLTKEEAEKKIEKLKLDEQLAVEQLKEAEKERLQLDEELRVLEQEEKQLELDEANFWRNHNDNILSVDQKNMQLATLRAAYAADSAVLEKLERTNVYNDAFCIGHDGVFGTINGLRLGRVPGVPVEWAEINAAWGQTLLLLHTIARKLDYKFENYRLVPMGSFSRIERTSGDKASYELYGSGHLGRLLHNRRFDFGMVAFIDCLKCLTDYIKSQDPSVDFPHLISKDKIGDVSIKLQFNQEEAWTRSLRHVLLALKICLKWATNGVNG